MTVTGTPVASVYDTVRPRPPPPPRPVRGTWAVFVRDQRSLSVTSGAPGRSQAPRGAPRGGGARRRGLRPPPPPFVLIGHVASLTPY